MMFVKHELEADFVMPLKANRKVALSPEDKQQGRYVVRNGDISQKNAGMKSPPNIA
jgi:hypothetical protein